MDKENSTKNLDQIPEDPQRLEVKNLNQDTEMKYDANGFLYSTTSTPANQQNDFHENKKVEDDASGSPYTTPASQQTDMHKSDNEKSEMSQNSKSGPIVTVELGDLEVQSDVHGFYPQSKPLAAQPKSWPEQIPPIHGPVQSQPWVVPPQPWYAQPTRVLNTIQPQRDDQVPSKSLCSVYLCLSIFVFLFCSWPLGIVAIVRSCQARVYFRMGQYEEADAKYSSAKKFIILSFVLGIICNAIVAGNIYYRISQWDSSTSY
ncbi:CD225/dispanin family protein [Biomphalaria pfeifferi]|uniref:CD225/dispanin family protein n=1 Tax=Biomphalaria pfeifferi TaxID=112525 RepID=A0AAD8B4H4_BIOPF|nr:CD225/dispanin family protein [Biomphalaria pfeifferi]